MVSGAELAPEVPAVGERVTVVADTGVHARGVGVGGDAVGLGLGVLGAVVQGAGRRWTREGRPRRRRSGCRSDAPRTQPRSRCCQAGPGPPWGGVSARCSGDGMAVVASTDVSARTTLRRMDGQDGAEDDAEEKFLRCLWARVHGTVSSKGWTGWTKQVACQLGDEKDFGGIGRDMVSLAGWDGRYLCLREHGEAGRQRRSRGSIPYDILAASILHVGA